MQINSVAADADTVGKRLGLIGTRTGLHAYMCLQDSELSHDPAAFADVRSSRQAVLSTEHVRAQS